MFIHRQHGIVAGIGRFEGIGVGHELQALCRAREPINQTVMNDGPSQVASNPTAVADKFHRAVEGVVALSEDMFSCDSFDSAMA